jgi:hypothetical protein
MKTTTEKSSEVKSWRYSIPNTKGYEGWAILFIDNAGCFAALSDYGDWTHRWNARGFEEHEKKDFRHFVLSCSDHYLLDKLNPRQEYDPEGTLQAVKEAICGMRRERQLEKDEAREEWEHLEDCERLENEYMFQRWMELTELSDAWELSTTKHSEQCRAFIQQCMPRLRELIKNDLGL